MVTKQFSSTLLLLQNCFIFLHRSPIISYNNVFFEYHFKYAFIRRGRQKEWVKYVWHKQNLQKWQMAVINFQKRNIICICDDPKFFLLRIFCSEFWMCLCVYLRWKWDYFCDMHKRIAWKPQKDVFSLRVLIHPSTDVCRQQAAALKCLTESLL